MSRGGNRGMGGKEEGGKEGGRVKREGKKERGKVDIILGEEQGDDF